MGARKVRSVYDFFDMLERRGFWWKFQVVLCIGCIIAAAILISINNKEEKENGKHNGIHQVSKSKVR